MIRLIIIFLINLIKLLKINVLRSNLVSIYSLRNIRKKIEKKALSAVCELQSSWRSSCMHKHRKSATHSHRHHQHHNQMWRLLKGMGFPGPQYSIWPLDICVQTKYNEGNKRWSKERVGWGCQLPPPANGPPSHIKLKIPHRERERERGWTIYYSVAMLNLWAHKARWCHTHEQLVEAYPSIYADLN